MKRSLCVWYFACALNKLQTVLYARLNYTFLTCLDGKTYENKRTWKFRTFEIFYSILFTMTNKQFNIVVNTGWTSENNYLQKETKTKEHFSVKHFSAWLIKV